MTDRQSPEDQLKELREHVRAFEASAGFKISDGWQQGQQAGEAVKLVIGRGAPRMARVLASAAHRLEEGAKDLRSMVQFLEDTDHVAGH